MGKGKILSTFFGLLIATWGIYLVVDTELKAPYAGAVPGMFGAHLGKVEGILLIILGVIFLFAGLVFPRTSFPGAFLALPTLIIAILTMAGLSLFFWFLFSVFLTVGYFVIVRLVAITRKI